MLLKQEQPLFRDNRRIAALDMLRALAVFLVIGYHAAWRFRPAATDPLGQLFKGSGWIGVDIFFVISGFMITGILLRDQADIRGFFVRRVYRILPIFGVALATYILLALATGAGLDKLRLIWSPALFLNGWTIPLLGYGAVPYTIAWSLSVEETAYVILGLACLAHARGLRMALLAFLLVAPTVRTAVLLTEWFQPAEVYFFVPARLDSIALGGLAALVAPRLRLQGWQTAGAGLGMFALIWVFQYVRSSDPRLIVLGYTLFALITAVFVLGLGATPAGGATRRGASGTFSFAPRRALEAVGGMVATFGKLSYFIYLFHIFVLEALVRAQKVLHVSFTFWQALPLASLIVFLFAAVSWKYFEFPLIARGRRAAAEPATPAAPQAAL